MLRGWSMAVVRQPILIFSASGEDLRRAAGRTDARSRCRCSIYTMQLFTTYNDADNRPQLPRSLRENLDLAGWLFMRAQSDRQDRQGLKCIRDSAQCRRAAFSA